jgi:hypothetical protein
MRDYRRRNGKAEEVLSRDDDPWRRLPRDLLVLANEVLGFAPPRSVAEIRR